MEPCLFRHGKERCWRGYVQDWRKLQWSHVFSDMVRPCRPGRWALPTGASMEPCLFRHGKDNFDGVYKDTNGASMEPCLFRHGKSYGKLLIKMLLMRLQWSHVFSDMVRWMDWNDFNPRIRASMEPCLFRHGKFITTIRLWCIKFRFNGAMSFQTW